MQQDINLIDVEAMVSSLELNTSMFVIRGQLHSITLTSPSLTFDRLLPYLTCFLAQPQLQFQLQTSKLGYPRGSLRRPSSLRALVRRHYLKMYFQIQFFLKLLLKLKSQKLLNVFYRARHLAMIQFPYR